MDPTKLIRLVPLQDGLDFSSIQPLSPTRDFFTNNMKRCLPLTMANQYGFAILAPMNFQVVWLGHTDPESLKIMIDEKSITPEEQVSMPIRLSTSFGRGILSIYPRFVIKTAANINTWVKQPPNIMKPGIQWFEGVVETDNLNSHFSFNLKMTDANRRVTFKKGDPIASFVPYPRFYLDAFQLQVEQDEASIASIRATQSRFEEERKLFNTGQMESQFRYRRGENFDGCPFTNHQTKLSSKYANKGSDQDPSK